MEKLSLFHETEAMMRHVFTNLQKTGDNMTQS